jgi:hypothetical protein
MTYSDTLDAVAAAAGIKIGEDDNSGMKGQISGLGALIETKLWGKNGTADKPTGGMIGNISSLKNTIDETGNEAASAFPQIGNAVNNFYTDHY